LIFNEHILLKGWMYRCACAEMTSIFSQRQTRDRKYGTFIWWKWVCYCEQKTRFAKAESLYMCTIMITFVKAKLVSFWYYWG